jgi:hypothetical protein
LHRELELQAAEVLGFVEHEHGRVLRHRLVFVDRGLDQVREVDVPAFRFPFAPLDPEPLDARRPPGHVDHLLAQDVALVEQGGAFGVERALLGGGVLGVDGVFGVDPHALDAHPLVPRAQAVGRLGHHRPLEGLVGVAVEGPDVACGERRLAAGDFGCGRSGEGCDDDGSGAELVGGFGDALGEVGGLAGARRAVDADKPHRLRRTSK